LGVPVGGRSSMLGVAVLDVVALEDADGLVCA
jgi:hypothetical protein